MNYTYAIIGGGLAAGYAAQVFADANPAPQQVAIFSKEGVPPYDRPPLSKDYLAGKKNAADTLINDPDFYTNNHIELYLNTPVTGVDLDKRQLFTEKGTFGFKKLLIATGAKPRTFNDLPGVDLAGIHYLRRLTDARNIRTEMADAERAVVIGGSFIGMEVAAVLAGKGIATTLTFPEDRVWEAFFTPAMSHFFSSYYEERGVTILPGTKIEGFSGENGRVRAVRLAQGKSLPADFVVAGIGVTPNLELFQGTPLQMNEGILVNRFLETNVPGVFAVGDVAEYRDVIFDTTRRVEHWDNAYQQGRQAAAAMLGERTVFKHVPYFFSDVFDLSYEFWGDPQGADTIIHRGDMTNGRFSVWWLQDAKLKAAFVMNRPDEERELAPQWIESGVDISTARLTNVEQPLTAATENVAA
jgi:NADPH-dependent 2,4-dienoyl-CoA reductase/sulfur reductase-like enzyme